MTRLFSPFEQRGLVLKNRIVVSPMCQYSSTDGYANDWHLVHLGGRAVGGAGLIMTEATAVLPEGRISPQDLGLWKDDQMSMLARIAEFVKGQGAAIGIQLAHAGRKASTYRPWSSVQGEVPVSDGGWEAVAPSPERYADGYPMPRALDDAGIARVIAAFVASAARAVSAGFQVIEIHAAHGYLLQEFLSPASNHRTDRWGGSFEGRVRLLEAVVTGVRDVIPTTMPLWVRISATDWSPNGWTIDDSVALAKRLGPIGVDLVDCSSGGNVTGVRIPVGPGYQTPFAERLRREAGVATGTVGFITAAEQADHIIRTGQADVVLLARELLRDPNWPLRAAVRLGAPVNVVGQYRRAW